MTFHSIIGSLCKLNQFIANLITHTKQQYIMYRQDNTPIAKDCERISEAHKNVKLHPICSSLKEQRR